MATNVSVLEKRVGNTSKPAYAPRWTICSGDQAAVWLHQGPLSRPGQEHGAGVDVVCAVNPVHGAPAVAACQGGILPGGSQSRQNVAAIASYAAFCASVTCVKLEFGRSDLLFRPSLTLRSVSRLFREGVRWNRREEIAVCWIVVDEQFAGLPHLSRFVETDSVDRRMLVEGAKMRINKCFMFGCVKPVRRLPRMRDATLLQTIC